MKKLCFLIAVLILLNCLPFCVAADSTSSTQSIFLNQYYATHYFSNLNTNYGWNLMGSCGYVAIGMLLSYYDTYWDDNIIPEDYDQICNMPSNEFDVSALSSPGIKREIPAAVGANMTPQEYLQACQRWQGNYYHLDLIYNNPDYTTRNINQNLPLGGLTFNEIVTILKNQLADYNYPVDCIKVVTASSENKTTDKDIRDFIISHVKQGTPVLIGMRKHDDNGEDMHVRHAMIAYDYDATNENNGNNENNGILYVHDGIENTHIDHNAIDYKSFIDAAVLEFETDELYRVEHNCSNNYVFDNDGTTVTYCPCQLDIHPEYEAPNTGGDSGGDSGDDPDPEYPVLPPVEVHYHDEYWDVCADWHSYSCEECDLIEIEVPHEYVRYGANTSANSGTTHRKYCHCGYYVVEDHVVRATNDGSATFPAQCMICGLIATGGSVGIVSIPITPEIMTMGTYTFSDGTTVQILTENGSYVLPNGIIVLVGEDAELAEAGLLDPYALVENLPTPSNPGQVTE